MRSTLSASATVAIFAAVALATGALDFPGSSGLRSFSSFGVNSHIAEIAVVGAIIILFARPDDSGMARRNLVLVYVAGVMAVSAVLLSLLAARKMFPSISMIGASRGIAASQNDGRLDQRLETIGWREDARRMTR